MKRRLLIALNRLRNAINFFLKLISAFFCAYILFALTVEYIDTLAGVPGWEKMTYAPLNADSIPEFIGHAVGDLILLPPVIYFGVAFGRFLLRAAPPLLSGRVRFGVLLISLLPILGFTLLLGLILFYIITSGESFPVNRSLLISTAHIATLFLIWCAACAFSLLRRHLKSVSFLDRPFVLFLRRFSKFSDRAVLNLVLRQTPPGKPIVFLVPARSRAEDWNPFLVGFAGMKFLHPFRSIPIILKSDDSEWIKAVKLLIDRAQIIILDISETSGAIEAEYELISEAACWQKMIFLKNDSAKMAYEFEQNIRPSDSRIIYYRESWIRGIPRMLLGFYVIVISFPITALPSIGGAGGGLFFLFYMLIIWWIHFSLFRHSSIDRISKILLGKMLRADGKSDFNELRA